MGSPDGGRGNTRVRPRSAFGILVVVPITEILDTQLWSTLARNARGEDLRRRAEEAGVAITVAPAVVEWLDPWVDVQQIASSRPSWRSLWLYEVPRESVPLAPDGNERDAGHPKDDLRDSRRPNCSSPARRRRPCDERPRTSGGARVGPEGGCDSRARATSIGRAWRPCRGDSQSRPRLATHIGCG